MTELDETSTGGLLVRYTAVLVGLEMAAFAVSIAFVELARPDLTRGWHALAVGGVLPIASALLVWPLVCKPLVRQSEERQARRTQREAAIVAESRRQEFDARLGRALEMAELEEDALGVVQRAMETVVGSQPTELLLADSSRAHLSRAAETGPEGRGPGCGVDAPRSCTAVRRGQTLLFESSEDLDACPKLRGREIGACSAVCVPVTVLGKAIGVLHMTAADGSPPEPSTVVGLEAVAHQTGTRIGMIRALERSEVQAATDPLTGLFNRRSLENRVRSLTRERKGYAVALADLDHFKLLNDTHGHESGDKALRLFAATMQASVRPTDLVARYGGEEFVIVFPEATAAEATAAVERVREELALALASGTTPTFTSSFGVADLSDGATFDEVLGMADAALLEAKRAGRNRVVQSAAMPARPGPAAPAG